MDEKSKKFTNSNSIINLSHTLAIFKPKQLISIPTILNKLQQRLSNMQRFCSLRKLEKLRNNLAVTPVTPE